MTKAAPEPHFDTHIQIRISHEEKAAVRAAAVEFNMGMSDMVRVALGFFIPSERAKRRRPPARVPPKGNEEETSA